MSTNFQNSINAGLGVAAGVAAASGAVGARKEQQAAKVMESALEKQQAKGAEAVKAAEAVDPKKAIPNKVEREALKGGIEARKAEADISEGIAQKHAAAFNKRPTEENYNRMQQAQARTAQMRDIIERDEQRLQKALERVDQRNAARRKQYAAQKERMTQISKEYAGTSPEFQRAVYKELYGNGTDKKQK